MPILRRKIVLIACILAGGSSIWAQVTASKGNMHLGAYYSLIMDRLDHKENPTIPRMDHHCLNLHFRYPLLPRFYLGAEGIMAVIISNLSVENPFFLGGLHGEFFIIDAERARLVGRLGGSSGNLSYAGEDVPQRRWVVNVAFGGSLEVKVMPWLSLDLGFYYHHPVMRPENYGRAQPFIGAHIQL